MARLVSLDTELGERRASDVDAHRRKLAIDSFIIIERLRPKRFFDQYLHCPDLQAIRCKCRNSDLSASLI